MSLQERSSIRLGLSLWGQQGTADDAKLPWPEETHPVQDVPAASIPTRKRAAEETHM